MLNIFKWKLNRMVFKKRQRERKRNIIIRFCENCIRIYQIRYKKFNFVGNFQELDENVLKQRVMKKRRKKIYLLYQFFCGKWKWRIEDF